MGWCEYSSGFVPSCYYLFSSLCLLPDFGVRTQSPRISHALDKTKLQCAVVVITCNVSPVILNYWKMLGFSPAHLHAWCRVRHSSSLLKCACIAFCLPPRSWALCLGWSPGGWGEGGLPALCGFSETFWGLLALPGRTGEIYRSQEASQVHETPQHLAGAFRNRINQPPHLDSEGGIFPSMSRLASLHIGELLKIIRIIFYDSIGNHF